MEAILKRWYIGLFIVPILVRWLSNFVLESPLLSDPKDLSLVFLGFLVFVLAVEVFRKQESDLSDHDKDVAVGLIRGIDLDNFNDDFFLQDSHYGYKRQTLDGTFIFNDDFRKLSFQVDNK